MLIPLKPGELQRLIPAVATGPQFLACSGDPRKLLQRVLISVIGGVITLLISQTLAFNSRFSSLWLVAGVILLLYLLWGPIVEAGRRNAVLRRYPAAAIFEGEVADLYNREVVEDQREQADTSGRLQLVETGAPGCAWSWRTRMATWAGCVFPWRKSTRRSGGGWWCAAWC